MTVLKNGDMWPMSVKWSEPTDIVITDPCYFMDDNETDKWNAMLDAMNEARPVLPRPLADVIGGGIMRDVEETWKSGKKVTKEMLDELCMRMRVGIACARSTVPRHRVWAPMRQDAWAEFGISKCLCGYTVYGDWSCGVVDDDKHTEIGGFCADSGMYIVCALGETTEHFRQELKKHPHIATIICGFDGIVACRPTVGCMYIDDGWHDQYDISLVGSGSVNFHTFQTGF